jgi:hypothetical protein
MDNEFFKRWMTDTVFGLTYDQPRAGCLGVRMKKDAFPLSTNL